MSLTLILQTTELIDIKTLSIQANANKKNLDIPGTVGRTSGSRNIKNLSSIGKLKNLTKKSILAKANSFKTAFLTFGARKAFIHLQKAFSQALILHHFDLKCHIWIETDVLVYAIGKVLSQITLDQLFSDHII